MKNFLIFALFIFNHDFSWVDGAEDEHAKHLKMSGCEKFKDFADMDLPTCCPSIPDLHHHEHFKSCMDCKTKEKGEKMCCWSDCMLKTANLVNSTGFMDIELVKAKLNELVDKNATWSGIIDEVIEECIKEAPSALEEFQTKHPDHAPKCDTAINIVLKHCMRRNLFFKCPFKEVNPKCDEFTEFGKSCKMFPAMRQMIKMRKAPEEEKEASESE